MRCDGLVAAFAAAGLTYQHLRTDLLALVYDVSIENQTIENQTGKNQTGNTARDPEGPEGWSVIRAPLLEEA